jgi:hypothetical protein
LLCLRLRQNQTMRPISNPMPNATPITIPMTVPLLMPFELTEPCPRVGSAVADGVIIMVLTWPVTVTTLVIACVASGVVLGSGVEVLGLGVDEELGLGAAVEDGDVMSVLGGACMVHVSARF